MPSPFPGMDPYLEDPDIWPGFHTALFVDLMKSLNRILPAGYIAKIDRYVWIHEPSAEDRILLGKPDTYVTGPTTPTGHAQSAAALSAPATIVLPAVRQEGNRYLKIVDAKSRRVVTVLEILSPANKKAGIDRDAYLMKRNEYLATGVNVIELDFLRTGLRMPWGKDSPPHGDYYIMVSRGCDFPKAGVWSLTVRDAFPAIPIPLDPGLAEPRLALKECFDNAFIGGKHEEEIDYKLPAVPPLAEPDARWVSELLRSHLANK